MDFPYWRFFQAIESDLVETTRYVELAEGNYGTYSVEYARIILSSCSEVDVVSKVLCSQIDPQQTPGNINEYRSIITSHFPSFHSMQVTVPRYGLNLQPWQEWAGCTNPSWWQSYNKVKHERNSHFHEAKLENAIKSVAGLFCLVLYLYHEDMHTWRFHPKSKLFSTQMCESKILVGQRFELPDFPHKKA